MAIIKPKVSIITPAFNQIKFIRQTIESILSQNTKFSFEILIHDDASNDGTADIIKEFENKYPDIVKPIYAKSNRFSRADYKYFNELFSAAKGEYIAMCEGDDYWTDNDKLQTQVDYMEKHPSTTVCFHPVEVVYEDGRPSTIFPEKRVAKEFTKTNLLKRNYIQTNSVMYRRADYSQMQLNFMPIDWYLHLYHAKSGSIGYIDKVMSVYRRHSGGIWWGATSGNLDKIWDKYGLSHISLFEALLKLYGDNDAYKEIINNHTTEMIFNICSVKSINKDNINTLISSYQSYVAEYLIKTSKDKARLEDKNDQLSSAIDKKIQELQTKNNEILSHKNEINQLENELKSIKDSKSWKIIQKYRKLHDSIFR